MFGVGNTTSPVQESLRHGRAGTLLCRVRKSAKSGYLATTGLIEPQFGESHLLSRDIFISIDSLPPEDFIAPVALKCPESTRITVMSPTSLVPSCLHSIWITCLLGVELTSLYLQFLSVRPIACP